MPRMTCFITFFYHMAVSVLTKINFLKLENLCMLLSKSKHASYADHIDTPHDLLHHYFPPPGDVRAHHNQLLEVGELFCVIYLA